MQQQNRPLCNVGLVLKSYMEGVLSMTLGAWLVFTESYTGILDAALLGPSESASNQWVDDAFFGYVCTAKVTGLLLHVTRVQVLTRNTGPAGRGDGGADVDGRRRARRRAQEGAARRRAREPGG